MRSIRSMIPWLSQSLPHFHVDSHAAEQDFHDRYPTFRHRHADAIRARDFARLDDGGHCYLDHTGGNLYPESLLRDHAKLLSSGVFGNPHSDNPTSVAMTRLVDSTRARVLRFFNAPADEYAVIFTSNASGALKLVGESYPFEPGDCYLLTTDNHNSVLGIREFDRVRGAVTRYIPMDESSMTVPDEVLIGHLETPVAGRHKLFAFPAQSNFTGIKHPLRWIDLARERGWDVLLDAAAFVPTTRLDLSVVKPDFVAMSFYKVFGYPTGLGALVARRESLAKLRRPWFGGGTIVAVSVKADRHFLAPGEAGFEDGTINYLGIPAIAMGLDYIDSVGLDVIHDRVNALGHWTTESLSSLRHTNGQPLVAIYGTRDPARRGGNIAFNLFSPRGKPLRYKDVESLAGRDGISLRTGCFCNPGTGEVAFGLAENRITSCFAGAASYTTTADFRSCFEEDEVIGAIRVSFGMASTFGDAWRFVEFCRKFLQ